MKIDYTYQTNSISAFIMQERKIRNLLENYTLKIKKTIDKAAKIDHNFKVFGSKKHKYILNPVISLDQIRLFEQKYQITLPKEYVYFLTQIGNGGAGPYYGLYSLETVEQKNYYLKESVQNPVFIDKTLTPELWKEKTQILEDSDCSDEVYDEIESQVAAGGLEIGTQGCSYGNILMYKGSETGKIVYFDWDISSESSPYLTGMTFLDWYLSFFEEIAAGHNVTSYGYKLLCTEETLIELFCRAEKLEEKQDILSSFYRFPILSEQSIALLVNIKDHELDRPRLALLFKNNTKKALQVFDQLLEGQNINAAVISATYMPNAYKNRYYKRMLEILYGENNVDKESILYFLKECSCKKAVDIAGFAQTLSDIKTIRTTIDYMGKCDDVLDCIDQFITWMQSDCHSVVFDALYIMKQTKSKNNRLLKTFEWMKTKYQKDKHIYTLLSVE